VVDAAAWAASDDAAQIVIAAACQQRRVTPGEIEKVLAMMPRVRRRALIGRTIDDIAGGAQALSELDFIRLCRRFGLPEPDRQERRRDASGRNRYLDAYWRRWRLHVEIDGSHHMWIAGDRILRFPATLLRQDPAKVMRQIHTALLAAGFPRS
jgi:hypothetical protein